LTTHPIPLFRQWFEEAKANPKIIDPTVMTLATANRQGFPSARIVLLKGFDERGFVFYTNLEGRKSRELKENPKACLNFYWEALNRQVRIYGTASLVSDEEADCYYESRPLLSRLGAWASLQSQPLESRDVLMQRLHELEKQYTQENPPARPVHWSGWRITPLAMEFWQNGEYRLHEREVYTLEDNQWSVTKLYP